MNKKQLLKEYKKALDAENAANIALQELSRTASDVLGEDVIADICVGGEIEFRHVDECGAADEYDTILLEDIIERIG